MTVTKAWASSTRVAGESTANGPRPAMVAATTQIPMSRTWPVVVVVWKRSAIHMLNGSSAKASGRCSVWVKTTVYAATTTTVAATISVPLRQPVRQRRPRSASRRAKAAKTKVLAALRTSHAPAAGSSGVPALRCRASGPTQAAAADPATDPRTRAVRSAGFRNRHGALPPRRCQRYVTRHEVAACTPLATANAAPSSAPAPVAAFSSPERTATAATVRTRPRRWCQQQATHTKPTAAAGQTSDRVEPGNRVARPATTAPA